MRNFFSSEPFWSLLVNNISVIITAYNRKEFLIEAVNSVIENDYPREKYEIIVAKNFEDKVIDDFLYSHDVKVIHTGDTNIGDQIYRALYQSRGDILCFLDDDDRFKSDKLKNIEFVFNEHSDLSYYHNLADSINDRSDLLTGNIHKRIRSKVILRDGSADEIAMLLKNRKDFTLYSLMFNLSCVSVRKESVIPYAEYLRKIIDGTDWFLFYCVLMSGALMIFDILVLTDYRVHRSVSNIFTSNTSIREISQFTINKFDKEGHFTSVLAKFCMHTKIEKLLMAKILEEKIVKRILGVKPIKISVNEYVNYISLIGYVVRPSIKNIALWAGFSFLSFSAPSLAGVVYNLYRKHSLIKGLSVQNR